MKVELTLKTDPDEKGKYNFHFKGAIMKVDSKYVVLELLTPELLTYLNDMFRISEISNIKIDD